MPSAVSAESNVYEERYENADQQVQSQRLFLASAERLLDGLNDDVNIKLTIPAERQTWAANVTRHRHNQVTLELENCQFWSHVKSFFLVVLIIVIGYMAYSKSAAESTILKNQNPVDLKEDIIIPEDLSKSNTDRLKDIRKKNVSINTNLDFNSFLKDLKTKKNVSLLKKSDNNGIRKDLRKQNASIYQQSDFNESKIHFFYASKQVENFVNIREFLNFTLDSRKIFFLIHGFHDSVIGGPAGKLKQNILKMKEDSQIIGLDWSHYSGKKSKLGVLSYPFVIRYIEDISKCLLKFFEEHSINAEKVHMIAHSAGTYIVTNVAEQLPKKISRFTILDGAHPFMDEDKIKKEHYGFLELFHTATFSHMGILQLGIRQALGHSDVIVNGGREQPGCWPALAGMQCSHELSINYYGESLLVSPMFSFYGVLCSSVMEAELNLCTGESKLVGYCQEMNSKSEILYLATNEESPFAKTVSKRSDWCQLS